MYEYTLLIFTQASYCILLRLRVLRRRFLFNNFNVAHKAATFRNSILIKKKAIAPFQAKKNKIKKVS